MPAVRGRSFAMRHVVPVIAFCMLWIGYSNATTVHLVFSNHLDVGFHAWGSLGFDNAVLNTYFELHFPRAARLADEARAAKEPFHFVYMTHPFIITLFLDCPAGMGLACPNATSKALVSDAIRRGDISWHALPHNAQAEVYDPSLLQAAIDVSRRLDKQFGFAPKAAMSQRDIPGLTRGAVPVLSRAGVKVLTVGVNGGSSPPGVPHFQPFIWRDTPSGEEIVAMWHPGGYGGYWEDLAVDSKQDCIKAKGFDHVLCVAWRGDNDGPPNTLDEVMRSIGHVKSEWPGAEVIVGDLEDYSKALLAAYKTLDLPVVTEEVGDTWIHGVSSDAAKLADYRTVLRLRNSCLASGDCQQEDPKFQNFSRLLVKIPEHTWGLDTKDGLNDYVNWTNTQLQTCLKHRCPNYEAILLSWRRQYAYIPWAIEALGEGHPIAQAFRLEKAYRHTPHSPALRHRQRADPAHPPSSTTLRWSRARVDAAKPLRFTSSQWEVEVDPAAGTISRLQRLYDGGARKGTDWAGGSDAAFLKPLYSTYDEDSFLLIWNTYFYTHGIPDWFSKDFGKLNCSTANPKRAETLGQLDEVHANSNDEQLELQLRFSFPRWAIELAGAPETMWIMVKSAEELLEVEAVWEEKTATRLPEALWVQVKPGAKAAVDPASWRMNKLGTWISPLEVILNGSHALHGVLDDGLTVDSMPAPTRPTPDPTPATTPTSTTRRLLSDPSAATATEPHRLPTHTAATAAAAAGTAATSTGGAGEVTAGTRERLQLRTLDAGVVSPGKPTVFPIVDTQPDMREGVAFNLINNIWGTNFVMWFPYEPEQATMRFRFELLVTELP